MFTPLITGLLSGLVLIYANASTLACPKDDEIKLERAQYTSISGITSRTTYTCEKKTKMLEWENTKRGQIKKIQALENSFELFFHDPQISLHHPTADAGGWESSVYLHHSIGGQEDSLRESFAKTLDTLNFVFLVVQRTDDQYPVELQSPNDKGIKYIMYSISMENDEKKVSRVKDGNIWKDEICEVFREKEGSTLLDRFNDVMKSYLEEGLRRWEDSPESRLSIISEEEIYVWEWSHLSRERELAYKLKWTPDQCMERISDLDIGVVETGNNRRLQQEKAIEKHEL